MTADTHISLNNFADIAGVSRATVDKWIANGKCIVHLDENGKKYLIASEVSSFSEISAMLNNTWAEESVVVPRRVFTSIELFAGGGGLALGMHKAGFKHLLLNEFDKDACATLQKNMPEWNVVQGDIHDIDFTPYHGKVDLLTGGFPCQAFSYAGKRLGFEETRGTLFFELARAVKDAPAQKQTERCHPIETRPLTIREYARIQTFPDNWQFCGSLSAKYKQIGNAVPVNLAWAIGRAVMRLFNQIDYLMPQVTVDKPDTSFRPVRRMHGMFEGMVCDPPEDYSKS